MALLGSLPAVRAQLADPARFSAAFACVEECLRPGTPAQRRLHSLAAGQTERVDLAGGAFALLQAHVDVQAMTEGEELMETADAGRLALDEDLTPAKDVVFYRPFDEGSTLRLVPGAVAVFYPADGHRGGIALGAPALVRKVVVKVPVG
jgi:hypothetical protein